MYYDLLAKIKNAARARKESFQTSSSNMDFAVARLLVAKRFLKDAQKRLVNKKQFLEVKLLYKNGVPAMTDFRLMSKPSRRLYRASKELRLVRQGYGIAIISTSKGIMTNSEARHAKLGGEYLFEIW